MIDIPKRIFITGTDTGVGKTVVTAALASCLLKNDRKVNVLKPFQTGIEDCESTDIEFIYSVIDEKYDIDKTCPVRLKKPLSPFYAARAEKIDFSLSVIIESIENSLDENSINLVEGAGGLKVPITKNYFMSDLAKDLKSTVVIVARPGLGTVNHTLLTIEHARSCGLGILGVVISNYPENPGLAESTNISQLKELIDSEIIGIIPTLDNLDVEGGRTGQLAEKSQDFFVNRLGGNLSINEFLT